jgi:undecaprenyl-diphosphatase
MDGGMDATRCLLGLVLALTAAPARAEEPVFEVDPVVDGALVGSTAFIGLATEVIVATGELNAQTPDLSAELFVIDRWVLDRDSSELHGTNASDLGVAAAATWAIADTTLAAFGERPDSAATYGMLYLESATITWVITNMFKLAARRPRPRAYIELRENGAVSKQTQDDLSFYSLHTALTASIGATASYLALTRDGPAWEPWLVVGGSILATAVVGGGRAFAGAHFVTDVLVGLAVGTAIGLLVPHFHRRSPMSLTASAEQGAGSLMLADDF